MSEPTPRQIAASNRTGDPLREGRHAPLPLDGRRRRLLFRATHRGTHETDVLIGGFVARSIAHFTEPEIAALEMILELPEPDLADFLTGRRAIPPDWDSPMLRAMKEAAAR